MAQPEIPANRFYPTPVAPFSPYKAQARSRANGAVADARLSHVAP
jgi:hypothetical protein